MLNLGKLFLSFSFKPTNKQQTKKIFKILHLTSVYVWRLLDIVKSTNQKTVAEQKRYFTTTYDNEILQEQVMPRLCLNIKVYNCNIICIYVLF